jgi:hypothetical protein
LETEDEKVPTPLAEKTQRIAEGIRALRMKHHEHWLEYEERYETDEWDQ